MKILLVYYSLEGNTEFTANMIHEATQCDVLRLEPVNEPPKGFGRLITGGRQALTGEEPELIAYDTDPTEYDTIIIGTPIWAGTYAPAIRTFLSRHELEGKNIYLFACSNSGNGEKALDKLTDILGKKNNVFDTLNLKAPLKYPNKALIQTRRFATKILGDEAR